MSRDIAPFGLRMPPELKSQLEDAAKASGRSLNAEINARLEASFPGGVEDEVRASRQSDLAKLRASHRQAISDLDNYRSRLQAGDTAPYGLEWLQEVIRQCEYRAHRLERMIFRAEHELAELGRELAETSGADDPRLQEFERRIELARRDVAELKSSLPSVKRTRERAAIEDDIAVMEERIALAEQSLAGVKQQVAAQSDSLASSRAALRRAVEEDS